MNACLCLYVYVYARARAPALARHSNFALSNHCIVAVLILFLFDAVNFQLHTYTPNILACMTDEIFSLLRFR